MRKPKIQIGYIPLICLAVIWLFPIAWIVLISFRAEAGSYTSYFLPKRFTFANYYTLLTDTTRFKYIRWFLFTLSRLRFAGRKLIMNALLVLGMFPGFMSMIAVYYVLKGIGLAQSLAALVLVYGGGASLGYYVAKGYFDTIPRSIDEAARLDGATEWHIFTKITIPIAKPIIIYTILTSFMAPWADFIFPRVILGDKYDNYTIALGLYTMLERGNIETWYTRFAAGAVLVSIPITILFMYMQKYYVEGTAGATKG